MTRVPTTVTGLLPALAESGAWAVVSVGVWVVTLSGLTVSELCFAIGAGLLCGVAARASRVALGGRWRFRRRWLLWPFALLPTLVAETGVLFASAVRGPRPGALTTVQLPDEEETLANGREAAATLALCSTPGSIVADNDPEQHVLTVHTLLSAGPDLAAVVRR